jgi:hypothetical protein
MTPGIGNGGGGLRCLGGMDRHVKSAMIYGINTKMMWIERRLRG